MSQKIKKINQVKSIDFLNGMTVGKNSDGTWDAGVSSSNIRFKIKILDPDTINVLEEIEYVHDYDGEEDTCFCQHGIRPEDCNICSPDTGWM